MKSTLDLLRDTGAVVGVATACAFVFTTLYLSGYSSTLELNLFGLFSLSDYLKYAVGWITPIIIQAALACIVAFFFFFRILRKRVQRGWISWRRSVPVATASGLYLLTLGSYGVLSWNIERHQVYHQLALGVPLLWAAAVQWFGGQPHGSRLRPCLEGTRGRLRWTMSKTMTLFIAPALAAHSFLLGCHDGDSDHRFWIKKEHVIVTLRATKTRPAGILEFSLEDFIVLSDRDSHSVVAINKNEVVDMRIGPGK